MNTRNKFYCKPITEMEKKWNFFINVLLKMNVYHGYSGWNKVEFSDFLYIAFEFLHHNIEKI